MRPPLSAQWKSWRIRNLAELETGTWVELLLYDHPPIGKRLERGERLARRLLKKPLLGDRLHVNMDSWS